MLFHSLFFYIFSTVMVVSALMVVSVRNPVHSVLFLILTFVNGAGLFLLAGAEFLAMILVVVYVGAVMVLFLFVVMMLDVDFVTLKQGFLNYLPIGVTVALVLLAEIILVTTSWVLAPGQGETPMMTDAATRDGNIAALGRVLYTDGILFFQTAGLILLIAMVGTIALTLRHKQGVKRQNIAAQVARSPTEAITLHDIKPGSGLQD